MPVYYFGDFELDLDARQLQFRGERVHLERRPFELLALLVGEPTRVHTREEIIAALWPAGIIIDFDSGVNTLARKVRAALGDDPEQPVYIETFPGRGYRFIAPVTATERGEPKPQPAAQASVAPPKSPRLRRSLIASTTIVALAVAVHSWRSVDVDVTHIRLAVLPFQNLTGDPQLQYMASGLAQETTGSIAQVDAPGLSVLGAASSRALATSTSPLPQAARDVGVDFVVESSLRVDGTRMRVTSNLIRTSDGEQVWTASFDRELTSILELQQELATAIAEQVRQELSEDVAAAIRRRQSQNPQAYQLYLRGRAQWMQFYPGSVKEALSFYQKAVAVDANYGLAWAGIAHAATTWTLTADAPPEVAVPVAQHGLREALRLAPDLAETWLAQASYSLFIDWDIDAAETAARRAIELDPNSAMAYMSLAFALTGKEEFVEARAAMRRARQLDPLSPLIFANSAYVERAGGDVDNALELTTQAIAMGPEFWVGYFQRGLTRLVRQDYPGALQDFEASVKFSDGSAKAVGMQAYTLGCLGRIEEADRLKDMLLERAGERYVPPFSIAMAQAGAGDANAAREWMEHAFEVRDINVTGRRVPVSRAELHKNPAFGRLSQACARQ